MNQQPTITLEKVVKGIYAYTWYPALYMLAKLEKEERYEECAVIKMAMDGLLVGHENDLTTKTDLDSLDECFDQVLKFSHNQSLIIDNMPEYIDKFEKLFS